MSVNVDTQPSLMNVKEVETTPYKHEGIRQSLKEKYGLDKSNENRKSNGNLKQKSLTR